MKYVDEFRDPEKAQNLLDQIHVLVEQIDVCKTRPLSIMEVCGGHTHAIFRYGIETMLPEQIELVHGPGCPVCVLPTGRVDDCVAIATTPGVILATFGDAMRVPGSTTSLLEAKAGGADVRMVYSPLDALQIAKQNPDKRVVFFALGFETTMPSTALTVLQAEAESIDNFSLFCNHITIIPTLRAILDTPGFQIDGFLGPGHVSMVIGNRPYDFIAEQYQRPLIVTGFEPLDILQGIWMVLEQIAAGKHEIQNQYSRVVSDGGNHQALQAIAKVFEPREFFEWRGLGSIDHSGVKIRAAYAKYDAEQLFEVPDMAVADPESCQCGEVLKGMIKPVDCKVFGTGCTPETPMGALMVSSEGACAAYFRFGRVAKLVPLRKRAGQ